MKINRWRGKRDHSVAVLVGLCGLVAACAVPAPPPPDPVMACPHLPAPPKDQVPTAPKSGFMQILVPGHWDWDGHDYTWVHPVWQILLKPARPLWQAGHWSQAGAACVWHPAAFIMRPRLQ